MRQAWLIVRQRIEVGGPLLVLVRKPHLIPPDEGRIEASEVEETGIELNENVSDNYLLVRLALDALGCPRENESPYTRTPTPLIRRRESPCGT